MKIPKKKELLELQKKYRTDRKIGEVYGVPGRLVAYWRSKKNIGPYSLPKYSRDRIIDLWERYGDDRLAGNELGISGPGFRRWRMEYSIKNKPPVLKMEQLELGFLDTPRSGKSSRRETYVQKIMAKKSGLKTVETGQVVDIAPDFVVAVDNAGSTISQFLSNGHTKVWDSSKIAVVLNHMPMSSEGNSADEQKKIREFVKKQGILTFYDIGWGISHQVIIEEGLILPGQLVLGTDHYAAAPGCIAAYSTKTTAAEMAEIWSTGRSKDCVSQTIRVNINGYLSRGVSTSDIILKLIRDISEVTANDKAVEFYGPSISAMTILQRFTLINLAIEAGIKSAVIPFDDVTARFIKKITKAKFKPIKADTDAAYDGEIEADISYLTPQVVYPNSFKHTTAVEEIAGKHINHVVLGGFTSGCLDDLEIAATILRGRRIHRDTRMMIIPGSRKTYLDAIDKGYIRTFVESGCLVLSPSYGACMGANQGMLAKGERALTTSKIKSVKTNGDRNHEIYIASPATAAASALKGAITDPRQYLL
ncbi:MAG: 3-isopropylmalate dehydratase large subunit [candidate division Zixibacteria bacterium]|nr:3-isopropylmalate dehydratase large subunit [candidate division Zixibacteria bacterium]